MAEFLHHRTWAIPFFFAGAAMRSVVTAEDEQCIVAQSVLIQFPHESTDGIVHLIDKIAVVGGV